MSLSTPACISHDGEKVLSQLIRLQGGVARLLAGYDISKVKCETPSQDFGCQPKFSDPRDSRPMALRVANQAKLVRDSKTSLCFHHYDRIPLHTGSESSPGQGTLLWFCTCGAS
jgi:hypothetical protein